MYKIYKGESVVVEGESPLTITGINPNTDVAAGEYQAVKFEGGKESERVDIPAFTTLEPKESDSDEVEPESVEIRPQTNNLSEIGVIRQLNVTISPEDTDQTVTWSTEDENVARVDSGGLLRAHGEGETTIIATTVNGVTGTATVNVVDG